MDDEDIFRTQSPLGYTISCSKQQWDAHIVSGHPELEGRESDVLNAVESPYKVFQSKLHDKRHIYYSDLIDRRRHKLYTKVVAGPSINSTDEYTVITAYDTGRISEDNGKGVILYDAASESGL